MLPLFRVNFLMILLIVLRFFSILQHSRNAEKGRDGREFPLIVIYFCRKVLPLLLIEGG